MSFSVEYVYKLVDKYSGPLKRITTLTIKYKKVVKQTTNKVAKLTTRMKAMGRTMMSLGRGAMLRVTAPIVAIGALAAVSFAKLEKGLIDVNNLLSRDELKKYSAKLEQMQDNAIKTGYSISDVNKGLFDTISSLGAGAIAFETFSVAQKLAIAGNTELGSAVKGIASIMNTYRAENVTATQAANAFFSAQVKGVTTVRELVDNVGAVAPIARAAGTGFEELLATMTALTLGGLRTDNATTALRGAFNALVKPQENAAKVMDQLGIMYGGANIKIHGITESFRTMKVAMEKYGIDAVAKAIPNIRAFTAVTSMSDYQLRKVQETIVKIQSDMKTGDGMMRAWKDQTKSLAWVFARAKGSMTIAFKNFVKVFAPELKLILVLITKFIYKISMLPRPIKKVILTLLVLTAVLPPLIFLLGAFLFVLPYISAGLYTIVPALGMIGFALKGLFWPITAAILAISLMVNMFVKMYQNSAMLRGSFAAIGTALQPLIDGFGVLWDTIFGGDASMKGFEKWGNRLSYLFFHIASGIEAVIEAIMFLGSIAGALSMGKGIEGMKGVFNDYKEARKYAAMKDRVQPSRTYEHDYMSERKYVMQPGFEVGRSGREADTSGLGAIDKNGKREWVSDPKEQAYEGYLNISISDGKSTDRGVRLNVGSNQSPGSNITEISSGGSNEEWEGF